MPHTAFIGLGSNMGDDRKTMRQAVGALEATGLVRVEKMSSLYRTAPVGDVEQSDFLNAVVQVSTDLSPAGLLGLLLQTEQQFGRERTVRWGPRTLDLDLLFFGDRVESMPGLDVPHPEIPKRGFVLVPMLEIAPEFVDPASGRSMADLHADWQRQVDAPEALVSRIVGRW